MHRGPYEYSVPNHATDFIPQDIADHPSKPWSFMDISYTVNIRRDTGLYNAKLGLWLFLASVFRLHFAAGGRRPGYLASRFVEHPHRYVRYGRAHHLECDGGVVVGGPENEQLQGLS